MFGPDVRFGSKADMCGAIGHVRLTPESGHLRLPLECPLVPKAGIRVASVDCFEVLDGTRI